MNDSAKQYKNKEIADFNLRKSEAIFANDLHKVRKNIQIRKITGEGMNKFMQARPYT